MSGSEFFGVAVDLVPKCSCLHAGDECQIGYLLLNGVIKLVTSMTKKKRAEKQTKKGVISKMGA